MDKNCVNFVIKKLYFWTWIFNFLDYVWTSQDWIWIAKYNRPFISEGARALPDEPE